MGELPRWLGPPRHRLALHCLGPRHLGLAKVPLMLAPSPGPKARLPAGHPSSCTWTWMPSLLTLNSLTARNYAVKKSSLPATPRAPWCSRPPMKPAAMVSDPLCLWRGPGNSAPTPLSLNHPPATATTPGASWTSCGMSPTALNRSALTKPSWISPAQCAPRGVP